MILQKLMIKLNLNVSQIKYKGWLCFKHKIYYYSLYKLNTHMHIKTKASTHKITK